MKTVKTLLNKMAKTIQDIKAEFNKEIKLVKKSQDEIKQ